MIKLKRLFVPLLIGVLCVNVQAENQTLAEQDLIYTPDQMLNFNIENYLNAYAPHLVPHAEEISHWAGVSSISPKILISLIEQQTSLISMENAKVMSRPFGKLSDEIGFSEQLKDVSSKLAELHYAQDNLSSETSSISSLQSTQVEQQSVAQENLSKIYFQLFPVTASLENQNANSQSQDVTAAFAPSDNLLQLPYPVGASWRFGGSHSNTGSGSVYSSLDFHDGGSWGDNLSNKWVTSAAPGTVKIHSSCNMEVIHADGWSTQYYHLDNIQFSNGQSVSRNVGIANYANNKAQALCGGGQSTGPHTHFSLKRNGSYVTLQDAKLSGLKVNVGSSNYDSNCNRFYLLSDNGTKHCSGPALLNNGVSDTTPPGSSRLVNGVAKTGLSASTNNYLNYTFSVPSGATDVKFDMTGGTGDADLYVKYGSQPSDSSYDCRPYKNGNVESCTGSRSGGTYYVRIKAYSAFSGLRITASYNDGTNPPGNDPIDDSVSNISVSGNQWQHYTQTLAAGYSKFTVTISGGSGDADLYVRHGSQSTLNSYDCRPYKNGNSESCTFNAPAGGTWYLDLYGYSAASGVTLRVVAQP